MAKVIGLTGGFGTGKTLVASVFRRLGARVIDADRLARAAVAKGAPAYRKIVRLFGRSVLTPKGDIDRKRLAGLVFTDRKALGRLDAIVHPHVIAAMKRLIAAAGEHDVVVVDAPLLIEARLTEMADVLVVVKCPRDEQVKRCMKKFHMDRKDVLRRIGSQIPITRKIEMADFVVDNGGTRSETVRQAIKVWKEIV